MEDLEIKQSIMEKEKIILENLNNVNGEIETLSKICSIDELNKIFNNGISNEMYKKYEEKINSINVKLINDKILEIKKLCEFYHKKRIESWDEYNNSYKLFLLNSISKVLSQLQSCAFYNPGTGNFDYFIDTYYNNYVNFININVEHNFLAPFSYKDTNYIIFGKNGSGKTRLLNYIKDNCFNTNAFIMPSDRDIRIGDFSNIHMDYKLRYPLSNIFNEKYVFPSDILTGYFKDKMLVELQNDSSSSLEDDGIRVAFCYNRLINIFNNLGLERKVKFDTERNDFLLFNDELNIEPYSIKQGSDGEKSIIQFILYILLCPTNCFLFIDEPESHFNTALLNELFNVLEIERKDIVFIYCTHNIDFIELRENCKLVYLDKFDGNDWIFEEMSSFDDISIENIINIVGSKKNILFIESEKEKIDYRIYNNLFKNYKVIPVSSCEKVINNCKAINDKKVLNINRKAFGIIDNDFRSVDEIEKYKETGIYTLKYNEIENMILSPCILEYICERYDLNVKIEKFKKEIIKMAKSSKNGIVKDYISKFLSHNNKKTSVNYDGSIEKLKKQIEEMNNKNEVLLFNNLNNFCMELDKDINDSNYEEIIKKYPNKGFLSCITYLGVQEESYINWIIKCINDDDKFRNKILSELFDSFFN